MPWEVPQKKPTAKTPLKRKFPGPAGLYNEQQTQTGYKSSDLIPCSQGSIVQFNEGPWDRMRKDFEILNERNVYLPDKYNIAWIKTMAKDGKLPNRKALFLAGIICKLNEKTRIITVLLKDVTGEIYATIVNSLYEDYNSVLTTGSVVVLREVGVLTTRNSNCYITITAKNLVRVYSQNGVVSLRYCTMNDFIEDAGASRRTKIEKKSLKTPINRADSNDTLTVEDDEVLHKIFDGIDADLLFDDF